MSEWLTYFGWDVEHETIFARMSEAHGVNMANEANIDFL